MKRLLLIALLVSIFSVSYAKGGLSDELRSKAKAAAQFCKLKEFNSDFCILIDLHRPSGKFRLFVWDFRADSVVHSALCAHGCGLESTEEKPIFSNTQGSNCSSLGRYGVGQRSYSQYGINIHYKLHGYDPTNNNAYKRIVVLHSNDEMPSKEIYPKSLPMGYSLGCPVTDNKTVKMLDNRLKLQRNRTLLWIF